MSHLLLRISRERLMPDMWRFSLLLALFTISCVKSALGATDELPGYYQDYLDKRINEVNAVTTGYGDSIGSFVFITDTHVGNNQMHSPILISELLKKTVCDKVIWGGDAVWAYTWSKGDTPADAKELIMAQWRQQYDSFRNALAPYGTLYNVRGNHDLTIRILNSDVSLSEGMGYTYNHDTCFTEIVGNIVSNPSVLYNRSDNGCYYYFDVLQEKTRYLICDGQSRSSIMAGNYAWGNDSAYGISEAQMNWIQQEALLAIPSGYNLVVVIHEGITDATYPYGYTAYQDFSTLLEDFANKKGVFTEVSPNKVIVFSGHQHQDLQTYKNGILHIATANDCLGNDVNGSLLFEPVSRKRGTINEQLLDYVVLDGISNTIMCYRIGAGYDRTFHLNKIELNAGEHVRLDTSLLPVSFGSYNATGQQWDSVSYKWDVINDIVTVDGEGNVTAARPGEAVVFAKDENNNKEFYYINVHF